MLYEFSESEIKMLRAALPASVRGVMNDEQRKLYDRLCAPHDDFPVDWENDAPMWADFAAVDADVSLYFYENEPLRRKTYCDLSDGKFLALPDGRKPLRNWDKSLRRREVKTDDA